MSTSLRFRPRQGEGNVDRSSAYRWQSEIDHWVGRVRALFTRHTPHIVILVTAVLVFSAKPLRVSVEYEFPLRPTPTPALMLGWRATQETTSGRGGTRESLADVRQVTGTQATTLSPVARVRALTASDLLRAPVVHTTIPERLRREVITYVVEVGDTVLAIAARFGLEAETVMWANGNLEKNPDLLRPGQELVILPIDGVYHTVVKGDTIEKIATKYKADVEHVIECTYNELDPEDPQIAPGDKIIVPGGIKPYIPRQVTVYNGPIPEDAERGTGILAWPTAGRLTDRFGFRTLSGRWHGGLDISGYTGAPVKAADSGFVIFAGWHKSGYGNLVIIDHRNGYLTHYAHLETFFVTAGQSVGKGATIAAMGSSGNSTGAHLHLEIRYKGVRKNPELYLP